MEPPRQSRGISQRHQWDKDHSGHTVLENVTTASVASGLVNLAKDVVIEEALGVPPPVTVAKVVVEIGDATNEVVREVKDKNFAEKSYEKALRTQLEAKKTLTGTKSETIEFEDGETVVARTAEEHDQPVRDENYGHRIECGGPGGPGYISPGSAPWLTSVLSGGTAPVSSTGAEWINLQSTQPELASAYLGN